ncbi:MAG: alcohol dehydrogenase catalytic domain-containing protein [Pseudomonadota bacterium]
MRALRYAGPEQIAWVDAPEPQIEQPQDLIIAPLAVATCDLDWQLVAGHLPFPGPFLMGHEFVGDVVEVGAAVTWVQPGTTVAVSFQPSCGHCNPCGRGQSAACREVAPTSMFGVGKVSGDWGGAFAERIRVPFGESMVSPLPARAELPAYASAADNVLDGWRTVDGLLSPGDRVLIIGDYDSIPLYAVQAALALGTAQVTYCTRSDQAAANAAALGAETMLVDEWPERLPGHEITVCAVRSERALRAALHSTRPGGHCTSTTIFAGDAPLPMRELYMRGIHFHTGRVNSAAMLGRAVELIADGILEPLQIDTAVVRFDALIDTLLDRPAAKVVALP